jgi:hypothetical protein
MPPRRLRLELASLLKTSRNGRFRRILLVAARSGEGPLTEPSAAAQPWEREPLFMPHSGHRVVTARIG